MRAVARKLGWPTRLAIALAACFTVLAALVVTGATRALDAQAISQLRPLDAWGPTQVRYSPWMFRLEPQHMYLLLAGVCVVSCARRRSYWPAVFGVVLAGSSITSTVLVKLLLRRPDPHGFLTTTGGSFPSGHVVAVVVCLAGCLLLVWPRLRWWIWAPVLAPAALLAFALLVSAAHWPTDVLGGTLLALTLVSGCSSLPLRRLATAPHGAPRSRSSATTRV